MENIKLILNDLVKEKEIVDKPVEIPELEELVELSELADKVCVCGGLKNRRNHEKTKKHLNYVSSIEKE